LRIAYGLIKFPGWARFTCPSRKKPIEFIT
jgi:hypothetical protein